MWDMCIDLFVPKSILTKMWTLFVSIGTHPILKHTFQIIVFENVSGNLANTLRTEVPVDLQFALR